VLILRSAGTNCDLETEHAWRLAGARPERVHVRRLMESPRLLSGYQILTIPGGFSYGDDIAAGRILAAQMVRHLDGAVRDFVASDKLVLGICNGFQVLVQMGLLPSSQRREQPRRCTIAPNEPPGFQDRWVYLRARSERCVFTEPGRIYEMPIAHGEGRVAFAGEADARAAMEAGCGAVLYAGPREGEPNLHGEPLNPNGSAADLAGLCDETGRVLGLMPHPERFVTWTQHPCWTSRPRREEGDGLGVFRRAVGVFS
jgi:phosphoribosylformylglycinamidine synthase